MTNIPIIYKLKSKPILKKGCNFGLYINKFTNIWNNKFETDDGKSEWFKSLKLNENKGDRNLIKSFAERQNQLIEAKNGIKLNFITLSRLIIGMGNPHPLENGLSYHHILGVPYIPASSLKGAVKAYTKNILELDDEILQIIFGSKDQIGALCFLDMIPKSSVKLAQDIMTPHYSDYYSDPETIPGDWITPIPISFLAVDEKIKFQTGILPINDYGKTKLNDIKQWIIETLKIMGIGAKTSVGYGRMKFTEK